MVSFKLHRLAQSPTLYMTDFELSRALIHQVFRVKVEVNHLMVYNLHVKGPLAPNSGLHDCLRCNETSAWSRMFQLNISQLAGIPLAD